MRRAISKIFDSVAKPLAVLDRVGKILFVNARLVEISGIDARELLGQQCHWELPPDDVPHGATLVALAPPATVREGRIAARRFHQPLFATPDSMGQLFIPILDHDGVVQIVIALFGSWEDIDALLGDKSMPPMIAGRPLPDAILAEIRRRWPRLDGLAPLVGQSAAIGLAMRRTQHVASTEMNVLWWGPAGGGKRQIAEAVWSHRHGSLKLPALSGQFLAIECTLIKEELFTAMLETFVGRLRSDLPAGAQTLLLTDLQHLSESAVTRLLHIYQQQDNRFTLMASSQLAPEQWARRSKAHQDLWSLLAEMEVHIPGLRDRREDILPLCEHYLALMCRSRERALLRLREDAMELLQVYNWPGNVVELAAAMEHAVDDAVLTRTIEPQHLPVAIRTFPSAAAHAGRQDAPPIQLDDVLREVEKTLVRNALRQSPRNRAQAARLLGISRPRLLRLIELHGLHDVR